MYLFNAASLARSIFLSLVILLCGAHSATAAANAQLAWDSSSDPYVTGYRVYHGIESRNYSNVEDVQSNLTCLVSGISETQPHYFAVKAYSAESESDYSEELVAYTIQAQSTANGQIQPSGNFVMSKGSTKTFSITPSSGYRISDVFVDGTSVGAVSEYTFSNLSAYHTISAQFSPINFTIVASAGAYGTISPSGSSSVASGTSKTFTITPSANYRIAGVIVDGTSVGVVSSYTFSNVSADHTIAATFVPNTFTIASNAGANGRISPAGTVTVSSGATKIYAITPSSSYMIADVKVDGISVGAVSRYPFYNVRANHTIAATFAKAYKITSSAGSNGSISPAGTASVLAGTSKTYTITPASSKYKIYDVRVDGISVGAVSSYTFSSLAANHTIRATFVPITYTITAYMGGNGIISPVGGVIVSPGATKTYTITPAKGYKIADVSVDGMSVGRVSHYTFSNISANHFVYASFVSMNTNPVAAAGPTQIVKSGATVTLNGANSTDPNGGIVSYEWVQTGGPNITLSNPATPVCTFTAPEISDGTVLTFQLTVKSKSGLTALDTCLVNVCGTDRVPSAIAGTGASASGGSDQIVSPFTIVNLDGSKPSDPDNGIVSYLWQQISGPAVTISNANTNYASFIAPDLGFESSTLTFQLTVTDETGLKMIDRCLVNVVGSNQPPVAEAGSSQIVNVGNITTLDSSASLDSDSSITYRWTQMRGTPVTLSDPTSPRPTFRAPRADALSPDLIFILTVTDAGGLSASDQCVVTVQ